MALFRDWEIKRTIGTGSFGTVYEVENTDPFRTGERAAIKKISIPRDPGEIGILRSDNYDDESITNTFRDQVKELVDEYRIMQRLSGNTNIVNCRDVGYVRHDDGFGWDVFIVMELLTPLRALPADRFTESEIIRLGRDVCRALSVCQKHGIIHRDVKPDNIFLSADGDYKLGDFGISRTLEGTRASTIGVGTYDYMAPEVLRESYDKTVDIYSLGMVLYWLLNERRTPFLPLPPALPTGSAKEQARKRRFSGEPLPAPAHGSEELKRIVLKACAFDPKDRYLSADEMLSDLEALGAPARRSARTAPAAVSAPAAPAEDEATATVGAFRGSAVPQASTASESPAAVAAPVIPAADDDATVGAYRGSLAESEAPAVSAAPDADEATATVGVFRGPEAPKRPEPATPKAPEPEPPKCPESEVPPVKPTPVDNPTVTEAPKKKKWLWAVALAGAVSLFILVLVIVSNSNGLRRINMPPGSWVYNEIVYGSTNTAFIFDTPVLNCGGFKMDLTIRSYSGSAEGTWGLYRRDGFGTLGTWRWVDNIEITAEDLMNHSRLTKEVRFDEGVPVYGLAIHKITGKQYTLDYDISYSDFRVYKN